jgi:hypothetical protein
MVEVLGIVWIQKKVKQPGQDFPDQEEVIMKNSN